MRPVVEADLTNGKVDARQLNHDGESKGMLVLSRGDVIVRMDLDGDGVERLIDELQAVLSWITWGDE